MGLIIYNALIMFYIIFTGLSLVRILKKDTLFGIVYLLLIVYSAFCMIGYVNYSERMALRLKQYYGEGSFLPFYFYLFGFMVMTFLFWEIFCHVKINIHPRMISIKMKSRKVVFYLLCISHIGLNLYLLFNNWHVLSYSSQDIVKGNKMWLFAFITLGVMILLFYNEMLERWAERIKQSYLDFFFLSFYLITLVLICVKAGQRMELFMTVVGIGAITIEKYKQLNISAATKRYGRKKKQIRKYLFLGVLIAGVGMRLIHIGRAKAYAESIGIEAIVESFLSLMNMEFWVFQDWGTPALSLVTCMQHNIVDPKAVMISTFGNTFSFITKKSISLSAIIKARFDNTTGVGYGLYYATEGFMFCGYAGFVLSALFISLGYAIYRKCFIIEEKSVYHNFEVGIFAYYAISIVRGTSNFFIKGFLYYFMFGIIMYVFYKGKIGIPQIENPKRFS